MRKAWSPPSDTTLTKPTRRPPASRAVTADPLAHARFILDTLQATVDARDAEALVSLFDDPAVLIGTAGDGRNPDALRRYLTAVATQPESLRWEWREVIPFHQGPGT